MNLALLFREIIQSCPTLTDLSLESFSNDKHIGDSYGGIILEALLNVSITTIQNLNLGRN